MYILEEFLMNVVIETSYRGPIADAIVVANYFKTLSLHTVPPPRLSILG